jgi:aspartate racemase
MKTIGLLGGTSWPSTITYYKLLNQAVQKRLGGHHSACILLKSIDYQPIKALYASNNTQEIVPLLNSEISDFLNLKPDCLILCNVWLHKFFDMTPLPLSLNIPFFHAVEVIERQALQLEYQDILLIGTKYTMEDGFFEKRLRAIGVTVTIPNLAERDEIQRIQTDLAQGKCDLSYKTSLQGILNSYAHLDAVVLGCTELPLIIQENDSPLPILDPLALQCMGAMNFALD